MSILAGVENARRESPDKGLIHGAQKLGKSTFVAAAPGVIAADVENRLSNIDVPAVHIATWKDMNDMLAALYTEKHSYKTLMIDSITSLEGLLKPVICAEEGWDDGTGRNGAEAWGGQWVRLALKKHWPEFFRKLDMLQRHTGMGVWMTARTAIRTMANPDGEDYDRYRPDIGGKTPEAFLYWADTVLFATWEDTVIKQQGGSFSAKVKTSTSGVRLMHTTHTPSWDAGNSHDLPPTLPLEYAAYAEAKRAGMNMLASTIASLVEKIPLIKDDQRREKAKIFGRENRNNASRMTALLNRVLVILEEEHDPGEAAGE